MRHRVVQVVEVGKARIDATETVEEVLKAVLLGDRRDLVVRRIPVADARAPHGETRIVEPDRIARSVEVAAQLALVLIERTGFVRRVSRIVVPKAVGAVHAAVDARPHEVANVS